MKNSLAQPTRRLVSQEESARIENAKIPRSKFLNQWTRKTTFNSQGLYPILVDELLPGDHMSYNVTAYVRLSTPLFPMFDNQRVDTFFFFVPSRIIWDNWVKMMGEQATPGASISYTVPQIVSPVGGFLRNTIYDHMGVPITGQIDPAQVITINALPLRAYNLIFNEWFRDENVTTPTYQATDNGPDTYTNYDVMNRAKQHDYFTSALPWPQKFTAPTVPLLGTAPITGIGANSNAASGLVGITAYETGGASRVYAKAKNFDPAVANEEMFVEITTQNGAQYPAIYADLAQSTGISINQLREAWLLQQLLERDARGGTRYIEQIRSQYGVINPDFRLQRPEYIGGGQSPLNLTPIAQTAPTAGVPLGAIGAAGTSAGQHRASYAATEHGYVIGLINVRSELSYQQGLHKMWSRQTRYDFYIPALAELGEQAILTKEIYMTGVTANDITVFGYQERWQEYRTRQSEVTGMFRSLPASGTLDAWHLAQKFTSAPTLNTTFLYSSPPMARVLAAGALADNQEYLADILYNRTAVRPIPVYGTPLALGRF